MWMDNLVSQLEYWSGAATAQIQGESRSNCDRLSNPNCGWKGTKDKFLEIYAILDKIGRASNVNPTSFTTWTILQKPPHGEESWRFAPTTSLSPTRIRIRNLAVTKRQLKVGEQSKEELTSHSSYHSELLIDISAAEQEATNYVKRTIASCRNQDSKGKRSSESTNNKFGSICPEYSRDNYKSNHQLSNQHQTLSLSLT